MLVINVNFDIGLLLLKFCFLILMICNDEVILNDGLDNFYVNIFMLNVFVLLIMYNCLNVIIIYNISFKSN